MVQPEEMSDSSHQIYRYISEDMISFVPTDKDIFLRGTTPE